MLDVSACYVVLKWEHNEGALRQAVPHRLEQRRPDSDRALLDTGRGSAPAAVTFPPAPTVTPAVGAGKHSRAPATPGRLAAKRPMRKRPGAAKKKAPPVGWLDRATSAAASLHAEIAALFKPAKPVPDVSKAAKTLSSKTKKSLGDAKVIRRPAKITPVDRNPRSVAAELRRTRSLRLRASAVPASSSSSRGSSTKRLQQATLPCFPRQGTGQSQSGHFLVERLLNAGAPVHDKAYDLAASTDEALFRRLVERGGDVAHWRAAR